METWLYQNTILKKPKTFLSQFYPLILSQQNTKNEQKKPKKHGDCQEEPTKNNSEVTLIYIRFNVVSPRIIPILTVHFTYDARFRSNEKNKKTKKTKYLNISMCTPLLSKSYQKNFLTDKFSNVI